VIGSRGLLDLDGYTHLDMAVDGAWRRIWEQPDFDPLDPMDPVRLESYTAQNQAFIDSILEGRPPPVTGEDGRAAVELCQASLLSAHSGKAIALPL
jgi:myo-inositol 2-dehydrogenase/D-chiro-inositol 1-dehydrogenase